MPIARRVERRGAGLGDATDATNARDVEALFGGRERAKRRWTDASRAMKTATRTTTGTTRATTTNGTTRATGGGGRRARERRAVGVSKSSLDEGYNCVVREDGVMVAEGGHSERDVPGIGVVGRGARNDGKGNAPRCDSERQRGCEVRCELTGEGELVCEGIESGTYVVVNVADLDEACGGDV